jgi:hypothetical protein
MSARAWAGRLSVLVCALALVLALPGVALRAPTSALGRALPELNVDARLASLAPDKPEDYVRLAEEMAQEAHLREARDLARTLYVLGFELDRARPAGGVLARRAALGLGELTRRTDERAWLRAVAESVGGAGVPAGAGEQAETIAPPLGPDRAAVDLCTAMGLARAGEGRRARALLDKPGVRELLAEYAEVLGGGGFSPGEGGVDDLLGRWPCPTCRNRRVVQQGQNGKLCPTCDGTPGPDLSPEQKLAQLRAESLFLRGVHGSWAAQSLTDRGLALRDPRPEDLANRYRVDAGATVWRDGAWQKP